MQEFQEYDDLGVGVERVTDTPDKEVDFGFTCDEVGGAAGGMSPEDLVSGLMESLSIEGPPGIGDMMDPGAEGVEANVAQGLPKAPGTLDKIRHALAGLVFDQDPLPREPSKPLSEMTLAERAQRALAGIIEPQDPLPREPSKPLSEMTLAERAQRALAGIIEPQDPLPREPSKPLSEMTLAERAQRALAGIIEPQDPLPPDPPETNSTIFDRAIDSAAGLIFPQEGQPRN